MYDAIVVGARCAGSPTAMLLARKGYRVLLLDKAGFPSDTLSTHYIHQPGVAQLARWGLLDQVAASNCPPVRTQMRSISARSSWQARPAAGRWHRGGLRPAPDGPGPILVEAAVAAGVELREHFSVEELLTDGDRVTGIRGHAAGGATVTEQARIVIGADGLHSLVARSVAGPRLQRDARAHLRLLHLLGAISPSEGAELYPRPDRMIVAGPTNDGLTLMIVFWPQAEFHAVRADIEGNFLTALDLAPGLAERVRAGKRAERFRGTADLPNLFRQPYGPGWALVGDAGYHKDPITAQGISDAFRDADLLTEAIDAGLSGRQPLAEALAGYQRQRDEAAAPGFAIDAAVRPDAATPARDAATLRCAPAQPGAGRNCSALSPGASIPQSSSRRRTWGRS